MRNNIFEEDRKFVAAQVEKIKSGTAKFYSIEEAEAKLDAILKYDMKSVNKGR